MKGEKMFLTDKNVCLELPDGRTAKEIDEIQEKLNCSRQDLVWHILEQGTYAILDEEESQPAILQLSKKLRPRTKEEGYVYIVHQLDTNYVKIGLTKKHPECRLPMLQTGNPGKLILIGWMYVLHAQEIERLLHQLLEYERQEGEWFSVQPETLREVLLSLAILLIKGQPYVEIIFPEPLQKEVLRRTKRAGIARPL